MMHFVGKEKARGPTNSEHGKEADVFGQLRTHYPSTPWVENEQFRSDGSPWFKYLEEEQKAWRSSLASHPAITC